MRVPLSWLREQLPALPASVSPREVADRLVRAGLEVERVEPAGRDVTGVVVGEVLSVELVQAKNKNVRWVQVDVGEAAPRGIVCGAFNFGVGDRVPVALPGAVLPGPFPISARKTYGHVSDGMICSARELGVGTDHEGILVLVDAPPVGADAVALLHLPDDVLDIAVTPDRGYCLSVRGVARETATAFGLPFHDPADDAGPEPGPDGHPVRIEDPAGCDRYVARTVTGLDPAARSPLELQRRLTLAGMRPVSLAVDVTNAVMLGLGQPLHAFDRARLRGPLVVRRAAAGERLVTLDGTDRALHPDDLVIADDSGPVALAGVMGGASTEITADSTDIVLESAHFDPVSVARTSRRHRLGSEASRRFERGVDPGVSRAAAQAAHALLVRHGGADAGGAVTEVDTHPSRPVVRMAVGAPGRLAGRDYAPEVVRGRLADVGCRVDVDGTDVDGRLGVGTSGDGVLLVVPPSWRPDLTGPADLIEEVVRLEGYDTLPVTLPRAPAGLGLTRPQRLRRQVSRAVAEAGHTEVLGSPFGSDDVADRMGVPDGDPRRAFVRLANPLDAAEPFLRTSLLPGLFAVAARNVGRGCADLALYETGPVFHARPGAPPDTPVTVPPVTRRPTADELALLDSTLPAQPQRLAAVLAGRRELPGWWGLGRPADWTDAVAAAHAAARAAGVALSVRQALAAPWHPGRCAALAAGDVLLGHAGELHPRVVEAFGLLARTVAVELDLDALLDASVEGTAAPVVSAQPAADRDVALVVGVDVPAADVLAALRDGAGPLLESLRLFDVYAGGQLAAGERSVAVALRLRAPDRTLTAEEANAARDAAVAEAGRRTGARLRT